MGVLARMKSTHGDGGKQPLNLAAAATVNVPSDSDFFIFTGTATVTSLLALPETRGRIIEFTQAQAGGVTTLTNSPGTTTAGQMDLGSNDSANVQLTATDTIRLRYRHDGTWLRVGNEANN